MPLEAVMPEENIEAYPKRRRGRPPKTLDVGDKCLEIKNQEWIPTISVVKTKEHTEFTFAFENKSYSEQVAIPTRFWFLMFYSRAAAQIARG